MAEKLIWTNRQYIGEFKKTEHTKVVVELVARDGIKIINMRGWYFTRRDAQWKPAFGDGIVVPIKLPDGSTPAADMMKLMQQALDVAVNFKIDDPDNYVYGKAKE